MIVAQLGAGILDTAGAAFKQAYPEYGTAIDAGVKVGNAVTGSGKTSVPAGPQVAPAKTVKPAAGVNPNLCNYHWFITCKTEYKAIYDQFKAWSQSAEAQGMKQATASGRDLNQAEECAYKKLLMYDQALTRFKQMFGVDQSKWPTKCQGYYKLNRGEPQPIVAGISNVSAPLTATEKVGWSIGAGTLAIAAGVGLFLLLK